MQPTWRTLAKRHGFGPCLGMASLLHPLLPLLATLSRLAAKIPAFATCRQLAALRPPIGAAEIYTPGGVLVGHRFWQGRKPDANPPSVEHVKRTSTNEDVAICPTHPCTAWLWRCSAPDGERSLIATLWGVEASATFAQTCVGSRLQSCRDAVASCRAFPDLRATRVVPPLRTDGIEGRAGCGGLTGGPMISAHDFHTDLRRGDSVRHASRGKLITQSSAIITVTGRIHDASSARSCKAVPAICLSSWS